MTRRKLQSWHQQNEPQSSNTIWGHIKYHNYFDELADCETLTKQKILKVVIDKNISYRNLVSSIRSLLDAPKSLKYALFLRSDSLKSDTMFDGVFIDSKNVGQLTNSFLIDLMPSPTYYARKLAIAYRENKTDPINARKIFDTFHHDAFVDSLNAEFGFHQMILFLLEWLPNSEYSWPLERWNLDRLFECASEEDWMAIDLNEESHQMILMHTYNSTASSEDGLFDICLKLLNWFLKKCPKLSDKFLEMPDFNINFIADQLHKASPSNYCELIDIFIVIYEHSDEETQQEIEKLMDELKFFIFFANVVEENSKRHNAKLEDSLYQIQQIRFAEIRQCLYARVELEHAAELDCLIREKYPQQTIGNVYDLISKTPPGYYLFQAIYSAINGTLDAELVSLLNDGDMSMCHFIRMCSNVLKHVFESISSKDAQFEPKFHSILVSESNSIAFMFKSACLLFKDIWLCESMNKVETNLRFYKTSQLVNEILHQTIKAKPLSLNEWSEHLQQSLMVKWLCKDVQNSESEEKWKTAISEAITPYIKELVRKKYINFLQKGFLFKKHVKNSTSKTETYEQKWVLDRSENALRVYKCESSGKSKSDDNNDEDTNAPELILNIKSITKIIEGEEYLGEYRTLNKPKKRMFRKDKNSKVPIGIFIEANNEKHPILYDNENELNNFITALQILRFENYPESEIDKLLDIETRIRMINLKSSDISLDYDSTYAPSVPNLPVIALIGNKF